MPHDTVHDFEALSIDGQRAQFASQKGKVLLIVNTASACGLTPQLAGLQALWDEYRDRGLVVVGFPCNQFAGQDPGSDAEIAQFCSRDYGVSFPMMAKVEVNGEGTHPLWRWLKAEAPGVLGSEAIKWNFTKFLVDRKGDVVERFGSNVDPAALDQPIERLL